MKGGTPAPDLYWFGFKGRFAQAGDFLTVCCRKTAPDDIHRSLNKLLLCSALGAEFLSFGELSAAVGAEALFGSFGLGLAALGAEFAGVYGAAFECP